jgi:uncharacterized protein (DUF433 family)
MEQQIIKRITINPDICHGKPTIRNKHYPVENLLELMASGMTNEEILANYEDLEIEDLQACLRFAPKLANVDSKATIAGFRKLPASVIVSVESFSVKTTRPSCFTKIPFFIKARGIRQDGKAK